MAVNKKVALFTVVAIAIGAALAVSQKTQTPIAHIPSATPNPTSTPPVSTSTPTTKPTIPKSVTLGTTTVKVEVADTVTSREKGLSGRASLTPNSGMLFIFPESFPYGFWMKDMKFAIDIIFIDENKKIITIAKNASPDGYNQTNPEAFFPTKPVLYVLEVAAGFADAHKIMEGSTVTFN